MFSNKTQELLSLQNDYIERINKNAIKLDKQLNFLMEIQSNLPTQLGGANTDDYNKKLGEVKQLLDIIQQSTRAPGIKNGLRSRYMSLTTNTRTPTTQNSKTLNRLFEELTMQVSSLQPGDQSGKQSGVPVDSARKPDDASTSAPAGASTSASRRLASSASDGSLGLASHDIPDFNVLSPYQQTMVYNKVTENVIEKQGVHLARLTENLNTLEKAIATMRKQSEVNVDTVSKMAAQTKNLADKESLTPLGEDEVARIADLINPTTI
jgi:hypothetical protein